MSIFLFALFASLALMPLSIGGQEIHGKYFPNAIENANTSTIAVVSNITSESDFVLAKCPHGKYKHKNLSDTFTIDLDISHSPNTISVGLFLFAWIPILKKSSGFENIQCGDVHITQPNLMAKKFIWFHNAIWKDAKNSRKLVKRGKIGLRLPETFKECNNNSVNVAIFTKGKNDVVEKVDFLQKPDVYPMKRFYYFSTPIPNDTSAIKDPCVILESYNECPDIILQGQNITSSVIHNGKKINIIHMAGQNERTFNVELNLNNNHEIKKYYSREKITYSRMRYHGNRIETIENSSKMIQSKFDIKDFDLIKLEYQCPNNKDYKTIEQIYYFGPPNRDFHLDNEEVPYYNDETLVTPNCTINRFNFGYLNAIIYNNKKVKINELDTNSETKEKFNRTSDHILLAYKVDKITLKCIYATPEGPVTISSTFISGTRTAIGRDINGNEIYTNAVIHTNFTKKINATAASNEAKIQETNRTRVECVDIKKSSFKEMVNKNGKGVVIAVFSIIILVLALIITISLMFIYYNFVRP